MNSRNRAILKYLLSQGGEASASQIAFQLDCPQASVRRSIQELRREGWNISESGAPEWLYRLDKAQTAITGTQPATTNQGDGATL